MEAIDAFERIHFAKVKLDKDARKFDVIDNFSVVSFTATIPEEDKRCLTLTNLEELSLYHIVQNGDDEFTLKSVRGDDLGYINILTSEETKGPIAIELLSPDKKLRFTATKFPLIQNTNEFHVTSVETMGVVGRININRLKAIVSMQPELEGIHKVRIVSGSIILLGIYNKIW